MRDFFLNSWMPHGFCYSYDPWILWPTVLGDAVTAAVYFCIPFLMIWFARKRPDLPFRNVWMWFGAFIVLCGLSHVMNVVNAWMALYGVSAVIMVSTAMVSVITAVKLLPALQVGLKIPSPDALKRINADLAGEVRGRADNQARLEKALALLRMNGIEHNI